MQKEFASHQHRTRDSDPSGRVLFPLLYPVACCLLQGNFSLSFQGSNPGLDCTTLFLDSYTLGCRDATGYVATSRCSARPVRRWIEQVNTLRVPSCLPHLYPILHVQQGSWRGGVKWCKFAGIQCMPVVCRFHTRSANRVSETGL